MLLAALVEVSGFVAATSKRLEKIGLLASFLHQSRTDEIEVAVRFLSGSTRQGRIGIGYAILRDAGTQAAEEATLELLEVDRLLQAFSEVQGSGSGSRKREILQNLLSRATLLEQRFLTALLGGELRQGALEGIMADALAKACGIRPERIRYAAMMAGGGPEIAR